MRLLAVTAVMPIVFFALEVWLGIERGFAVYLIWKVRIYRRFFGRKRVAGQGLNATTLVQKRSEDWADMFRVKVGSTCTLARATGRMARA